MIFGPKFRYFFQLNEMRDEAKTWWLFSGPDVASSYFFQKKIRVALESRTLISVPLLQVMTLKSQNEANNANKITIILSALKECNQELENLRNQQLNDTLIRSKARWIEEGKKPT